MREPSRARGRLRASWTRRGLSRSLGDFFAQPPSAAARPARAARAAPLPLRRAWGNYHRTVAAHFKSPQLRQLFDRYPTYVGSSPYESPATLAVIPYIEYAFGGWHVRGGLYRLVERLVSLARGLGVTLHAGARVERIEHDGRRVGGVRLADGTRLAADAVVMNGDDATTRALSKQMRTRETTTRTPTNAAGFERSLSGFVMLLGSAQAARLAHHTSISPPTTGGSSPNCSPSGVSPRPDRLLSAPSRTDPALAPAGGETLFVMANAPARDDWDTRRPSGARSRPRAAVAGRLPE